MKKKLDLNNLLAKYEGISSNTHAANYYSPTKDYEYQETPIEQQFYQSRTYQARPQTTTITQPITGNFQMSKSQCEAFLIRVREELRSEQRGMINFAENSIKHIHQKFHANHQKIKRQILDLLEKAFRENERYITQELKRQNSTQPQEFVPVHHKIAEIDEDINRLLYGLKGSDYRKSIAETVVKDYSYEISSLKESVKMAKDSYLTSLGQVEPDRARIQCIREDLQKLFRLSKKTAGLVQDSLFAAIGSKFKNEQPARAATTYVSPKTNQPKQRQRKSFFNFGFNE